MLMLLIFHIIAALLSLMQATFTLVAPSGAKLRTSYALIAATLGSGVYLVVQIKAPLVQSCTSGLVYLASVAVLTAYARKRLLN